MLSHFSFALLLPMRAKRQVMQIITCLEKSVIVCLNRMNVFPYANCQQGRFSPVAQFSLRFQNSLCMNRYVVFRVYIANILLLLLLLTVSQVRCASAPVYSNQLIKFELLTQSIRQLKLPKNICMEDSFTYVFHTAVLYHSSVR